MIRILILTLLLTGCVKENPVYTSYGTVRSIWCGQPYRDSCSIVWEPDDANGKQETLVFAGVPPVWQGVHGKLVFTHQSDYKSDVYSVVSFERD